MIYGLSGVHRCGKTFLAEVLAERFNLKFQPSVVRMSFEQHGLYPDQVLTWAQRIAVQHTVMDNMERVLSEYADAHVDVILDRTPIDLIGYTMTTMVEEGGFDHNEFVSYLSRAERVLRMFDRMLIVQPHEGLTFKDEPYKGRKEAQHMRLLETSMTSMGVLYGVPVLPFSVPLDERPVEAARLLGLD